MNALLAGHAAAFLLAAVGCLGSIPRARQIDHADTRHGLIGLLGTTGAWAAFNAGYLLAPGVPAKRVLYILGLIAGIISVGAWLYFAAAFTGRSPRHLPLRRLVVGVLLAFVALKVTNPIHGLYFSAEMVEAPFVHLAIRHSILHWLALGLAYALSFVGFYMLVEYIHQMGGTTRPLLVLIGLTALPVAFDVLGVVTPWLLAMTYEPIGVAAFAIGVLFVYFDSFRRIQLAGDVDDPVIFLDEDDRVRDFNREARALFPALADGTGEPVADVLPEIADRLESDPDVEDTFAVDRDGKRSFYRVTSSPFVVGGTRTGRSIAITDVTEAERYRRELEQKTEQLEALNRVVRHDIRNDMNVVLGWGETLESHVDDAGQDALRRMLRTAEHTVELTRTTRDFIDALAGEGEPDLEALPLRPLLEAELDTARESYPSARFYALDDVPDVAVRANEMLSSVFRNLLNNAVQHSDAETPEVTVDVEERPETVVVRVADDGPGIPDEEKESIFGKGEKGLDSEGTGIGLYLVRTLVEQFDGSVHVEDTDSGGAVFVVELPKVE